MRTHAAFLLAISGVAGLHGDVVRLRSNTDALFVQD